MKNSAIVDGVVLTREQVERAVKQLDAPEPAIKAGQLVKVKKGSTSTIFMVLGGEIHYIISKAWGPISADRYRITDGSNTKGPFEARDLELVTVE